MTPPLNYIEPLAIAIGGLSVLVFFFLMLSLDEPPNRRNRALIETEYEDSQAPNRKWKAALVASSQQN